MHTVDSLLFVGISVVDIVDTLKNEFTSPWTFNKVMIWHAFEWNKWDTHKIMSTWPSKILIIQEHWPPRTWMIPKYWFYNCCIEFLNYWSYLSTSLKFNTFSVGCVSWRTQSSEICKVCIPVLFIFSRELAMQEGIQTAIQVPVTVSRIANQLWPTIKELAKVCNINCRSDLQVRWFH